uniref:Uncharacterized protein n=1 Tax=Meloidogyne enterolobii TaxID=390850 RepID=A0A6V7UFJ7_MELEN|nr:unnamed protein product [Meloidogyne enterolobii]
MTDQSTIKALYNFQFFTSFFNSNQNNNIFFSSLQNSLRMAKLCRCTWLPSSSPLLSCSLHLVAAALLLFGGLAQCAKVGAGKHELDGNGKISKLGSNMVVVSEKADLSPLKNLSEACKDVEWDGTDWIKILYKKDGAAKEGCVLDLVAKKDTKLSVNIGIKYSDFVCLGGQKGNFEFTPNNMLPFTYSLGGGEFEKLKDSKDGHREGTNNDCRDPTECPKRKAPYCLKVADFMVGFARGGDGEDFLTPMLTLVDEPIIWHTILDGSKEKPSINIDKFVDYSFKLTIDNTTKKWQTDVGDNALDFSAENPLCFKKEDKKYLRDIKQWEITDESHTDKEFKYLFTFYLLPQKAARSSWSDDGVSTKNFKLLVPGEKPTEPPPTTEPEETTKPPKRTTTAPKEEPSPASSSNAVVVVIITVVVFLIVLSIIGGLLWFLVFRKKAEEEEQPLEDYFGTSKTAGGTAGGTATKTKTGMSTVGGTQAKSGMSTTVGGGRLRLLVALKSSPNMAAKLQRRRQRRRTEVCE